MLYARHYTAELRTPALPSNGCSIASGSRKLQASCCIEQCQGYRMGDDLLNQLSLALKSVVQG
jgi:hypothetical protein